MGASKRKSPEAAPHSFEALQNKVQHQYSTRLVREITGTVITAVLFSLIVLTATDGMTGASTDANLTMVAEADYAGR